jgi:hypothetical protein
MKYFMSITSYLNTVRERLPTHLKIVGVRYCRVEIRNFLHGNIVLQSAGLRQTAQKINHRRYRKELTRENEHEVANPIL